MLLQRMSKNARYESPYTVIGYVYVAGLKVKPKVICTDRIIGTWKASGISNSYLNIGNVCNENGIIKLRI